MTDSDSPAACACSGAATSAANAGEGHVLRLLLAMNATMFVVEGAAGWLAESTGLLADSLDMLADASVYGIALYAVGRSAALKLRAARLSGWLQLALGCGVLAEVGRRALSGAEPQPPVMIGVACLALAVNVACVALLARHRKGAVHMRASWIFTANDALANLGVILSAGLVAWLGAAWPDWLIGGVIGGMVIVGALRILRLR
jgi:Co/Zn/Cd efflux system component